MADTATTTTNIAGAIAAKVVPAVIEAHNRLVVLPTTMVRDATGARQVQFPLDPEDGSFDVTDPVTQGTALDADAFVINSATATVAEKGVNVSLLDIARDSASIDVVAEIIAVALRRNNEAIDAGICALFPSLNSGVEETAATMTADLYLQARGVLAAQTGNMLYYDMENTFAVLHPKQHESLLNDLQNNGAALAFTSAMQQVQNGLLTNLMGSNIVVTGEVSLGGTGQYQGAIYHKSAFGTALQRMPQVTPERKADATGGLGTIYNISHVVGFVETRDTHGVCITSDS